jgi:hypothetical protein
MSTIIDTIQRIVRHELKNVRVTELGVVDDLFPHAGGGDEDAGSGHRMGSGFEG